MQSKLLADISVPSIFAIHTDHNSSVHWVSNFRYIFVARGNNIRVISMLRSRRAAEAFEKH